MPQSVPTVKIKSSNEQGFVVINESDFDPNNQELFSTEKQPAKLIDFEIDEPKRRGRPPANK